MAMTFQDFVDENKAQGYSVKEIKNAFKEKYDQDLEDFDADADYDSFKESFAKPSKKTSFLDELTPWAVATKKATKKEESFKAPQMPLETLEGTYGGATMPKFTAPVVAQSTPAPVDKQAAKKEEEGVVVPALQEAAEMFLPQEAYPYLPDFARPKQEAKKYKPVMEVGPSGEKLLGAVKGGLEEAFVNIPFNVASEINKLAGGKSLEPVEKSAAVEAYKTFTKKVEEEGAKQEAKPALERVVEYPVTIGKGVTELVTGLADLVNKSVGINIASPEEQAAGRFQAGRQLGKEVLGSAAGLTAGVVDKMVNNAQDLMETEPVTALVTMMPIYNALKGGAAAGVAGSSKFVNWVNKFEQAMRDTVEASKVLRAGKEAKAKVGQLTTDTFKTAEPMTSAIAEEVFRQPEAVKTQIKAEAARAAKEIPQAEVVEPTTAKGVSPELQNEYDVLDVDVADGETKLQKSKAVTNLGNDWLQQRTRQWTDTLAQFNDRNLSGPTKVLEAAIEKELTDINKQKQIYTSLEDIASDARKMAEHVNNVYKFEEVGNRIAEAETGTLRPPATTVENVVLTPQGLKRNLIPNILTSEAVTKRALARGEGGVFPELTSELREAQRVRLEQTGLGKEVIRRQRESFTTNNPRFDQAVGEIHNAVKELYNVGDQALSRERIASRFAETLKKESTILLQNKAIKQRILNDFKQVLGSNGIRVSRKVFQDFLEELDSLPDRLNAKRQLMNIIDENGREIFSLEQSLARVVNELPKKEYDLIKKDALLSVGAELADEAEYHAIRNNLVNESKRFITKTTKLDPSEYAFQVVKGILEGKSEPVISPFAGKKLADVLSTPKVIENIKSRLPNFDPFQVEGIIDRQRARFESMEEVPVRLLEEAYPEAAEQFTQVRPSEAPLNNMYGIPSLVSAIKWELKSRAALKNQGGLMSFFSSIKRNVTARSTPSLINNNLSNYYVQSLRSGNPLIFKDIVNDGLLGYSKWKAGEVIDPVKSRAYQAIERSNLLDTTEVKTDIGKLSKSNFLNKLDDLPAMKALEESYSKYGDIPFKMHEAVNKYIQADKTLQRLNDGYHIEMDVGKNTKLRVTRSGNSYSVDFTDTTGKPLPNRSFIVDSIEDPRLSQALGRAASFAANKLFFDYSDIGIWGKMIKSAPVANAMSGFYTYYLKSLDIPVLKRGMIAETLFPEDFISSNDPAVIRKNILSKAAMDARRMLVLNGMRFKDRSEAEEEAAKMSAFQPKLWKSVLTANLIDPSNVYYKDLSTTYPFKATDTLLRTMAGSGIAAADLLTGGEIKKLFQGKDAAKLREQYPLVVKDLKGELWSLGDVIELIGMGGNSLFNVLQEMKRDDELGKEYSWTKLSNTFLSSLVGRTPADILTKGIGLGGELTGKPEVQKVTDVISGYGREAKKEGFIRGNIQADQNEYFKYFLRTLSGMGWKKLEPIFEDAEHPVTESVLKEKYVNYLGQFQKELKAKLLDPIAEKGLVYNTRLRNAKTPEEKAYWQNEMKILNNEYGIIKDNIDEYIDEETGRIEKLF